MVPSPPKPDLFGFFYWYVPVWINLIHPSKHPPWFSLENILPRFVTGMQRLGSDELSKLQAKVADMRQARGERSGE